MLPYNETLYFWSPEQSFKLFETTAFGYKQDDVSLLNFRDPNTHFGFVRVWLALTV